MRQVALTCLLAILLSARFLNAASLSAQITDIGEKDYFPKLSSAIGNAKHSITVVLSYFSFRENDPDDPVFQVIQSLLLSHLEGIKVHVILNRPYHISFAHYKNHHYKNDPAFALLESSGVPVTFLSDSTTIYFNLVIIDEKIVIESTMPWVSGTNHEGRHYSNTWIESTAYAKSKLQKVIHLGLDDFRKRKNQGLLGKKLVLKTILLDPRFQKSILRSKKYPILQAYLYLAFTASRKPDDYFSLSFKKFSKNVFKGKNSQVDQMRRVTDLLKILERKYKLIHLKRSQNQIIGVRIAKQDNNKGKAIEVPLVFFKYRYVEYLSNEELLFYFTALYMAAINGTSPDFAYTQELFHRFSKPLRKNMDSTLLKLEKMRLLAPVLTSEGSTGTPEIPVYRLLPLIDPKVYQKEIHALMQSYQVALVEKAIFMAEQLNLEQDPSVIRDLCYFLKELGFLEVQKVMVTISNLPTFHPNRTFDQVKLFLLQSSQLKIRA